MRHAISILLTLSLLATMCVGGLTSSAQQSNAGQKSQGLQDPSVPGHGYQHKLPPSARIGSTPERRAAWDKLTPEQKAQAYRQLDEIITKARQKAAQQPSQDTDENLPVALAFADKDGRHHLHAATQSKKESHSFRFITQTAKLDLQTQRTRARQPVKFNHAQLVPANFAALPVQMGCYKSIEQFIRDFYQGALARQPNASELASWSATLAQAQAQGSAQLLAQAQALGSTLFHSQEYINRNRSDSDYVFDLYEAFLQRYPDQSGWDFWTGGVGRDGRDNVLQAFIVCDEFHNNVTALCDAASYDPDGDGLPNDFENRVADAFTPLYHVSAGETDQFVTLNNVVSAQATDLSIKQFFGQNVITHFRVTPQGFAYNNGGQLISVLRLDYLTIWNHDSGLLSGAACAWDLFGIGDLINELSGHRMDWERSALLVAAPVGDFNYNLDPGAYSTYYVYTAAHEFKNIGDHSMYLDVSGSPVPAFYHVELFLSLSKHSTYTFNPDYLPLTPWFIIDDTYAGIDDLYFNYEIDDVTYAILLAAADDVFFSCIVERFFDQGGQFAFLRTNVGEPAAPLNESNWINTPEINKQLTTPFFR
jgi:hypothetical protein